MPTTIPFSIVTNDTLKGHFDVALSAINKAVKEQFDEGRINKNDYAEMYGSTLTAALKIAADYALQSPDAAARTDKTIADTALTEQQRLLTQCQTAKCQKEILNVEADTAIKVKNLDTMDKDMELTDKKIWLMTKDGAIKDEELLVMKQKVIHSQHENLLILKQIDKMSGEILHITAQTAHTYKQIDLNEQQITNLIADEAMTRKRILTEVANKLKVDSETQVNIKRAWLMTKDGAIKDKELLIATHKVAYAQHENARILKEIDKIAEDTKLVTARTAHTRKDIEVMTAKIIQMMKESSLLDKKLLLMDKELLKMDSEIALAQKRVDLMNAEIAKMQNEATLTAKRIELMTAEIAKMIKEGLILDKELLVMAEKIKLMKQQVLEMIERVKLMKAQAESEAANTLLTICKTNSCEADIVLKQDEHGMNAVRLVGLGYTNLGIQAKTNLDIERKGLVIAQAGAERARYLGTAAPGSVLGSQAKLMRNQAASFKADVYKSVAKNYSDMFSVSVTQLPDDAGFATMSESRNAQTRLLNSSAFFE